MSPYLHHFGCDQTTGTLHSTYYSPIPLGQGIGVNLFADQTLGIANGNNAHGIVSQCDKIQDDLYLVTVCTQAERIAVRLLDGENPVSGESVSFSAGKMASDPNGIYYSQQINEHYITEDGQITRAVQIRLH